MTVREELIELVNTLSDENALDVLDYVQWLLRDEDDELSQEEWEAVRLGEEQIARGESITLDEYLSQRAK
jgi:hypothetical protein